MSSLEMKHLCEKCGNNLAPDGEAYICSFECTFCPVCTERMHGLCTNCGGALVARPRRTVAQTSQNTIQPVIAARNDGFWQVCLATIAVWTFISISSTISMYAYLRSTTGKSAFTADDFLIPTINFCIFAFLTPFAFVFAKRHPIHRNGWPKQVFLYGMGGLVYCAAHILIRSLVHPVYDPRIDKLTNVFWDLHTHTFGIKWKLIEWLFLYNSVNDIVSDYLPVVLIANVLWYYKKFRERELRAHQLETQLTKARLKALKSQLQPHFLFNTMHSISALILTNTLAADKMITRLGDFLRISLDNEDLQFTTLNREIEFVNGYLEIEKIRFEDRLNLCFDIASESLDAQMPHLLLQPLVENAVRHGIARRTGGGNLGITSRKEGSKLYIKIKDNGPGLNDNERERLRVGLGLRATRERLRTIYGDDQIFEIRSVVEGGGVEVEIWIPFRTDPRLMQHDLESRSLSAAD